MQNAVKDKRFVDIFTFRVIYLLHDKSRKNTEGMKLYIKMQLSKRTLVEHAVPCIRIDS